MRNNTFIVKSSTGKYNFCQDARCIHCKFHSFVPVDNFSRNRIKLSFCYKHHKNCSSKGFACEDFECNQKYVLVNQYVQLNLFENG